MTLSFCVRGLRVGKTPGISGKPGGKRATHEWADFVRPLVAVLSNNRPRKEAEKLREVKHRSCYSIVAGQAETSLMPLLHEQDAQESRRAAIDFAGWTTFGS